MPIRPEYHIYLAEGKFWPIFIEDASSGLPNRAINAFKVLDAPGPPSNVLLRAYSNSVLSHETTFVGAGFMLAACTTTIGEKFIWNPKTDPQFQELAPKGFATEIVTDPERPGQVTIRLVTPLPPPGAGPFVVNIQARLEFAVSTPWIVTGIGLAYQFIRSICTDANFQFHWPDPGSVARQAVISGPVTFTLDRFAGARIIRGIGATRELKDHDITKGEISQLSRRGQWPRFNTPKMFVKISTLPPNWLMAPVGTIPKRIRINPKPFGKAAKKIPPKPCLDPLTLEEVDCKSGKPKERDVCNEPFIRIPTPDDIVSLKPRPQLPWKKIILPNGEIRWQLEGPLTREQAEELIRRREMIGAIQQSPQPHIARAIGSFMQALDNIQDAILTGAVFARLLGQIGPTAFLRLARFGFGVADTIDFFQRFGFLPRRARQSKRGGIQSANAFPFTKRWNKAQYRRLTRRIPTFGELIQILQTTDWLFGIGISLGAIIGFILDILFGIFKRASIGIRSECMNLIRRNTIKKLEDWGKIPTGAIPISVPPHPEAILPGLTDLTGRPLTELRLDVFSPLTSASHRRIQAIWTQPEYALALFAYSSFLDMAIETSKGENMDELIDAALKRPIQASRQPGTSSSLWVEQGLIPLESFNVLPIPGNPEQATVEEMLKATAASNAQCFRMMIDIDPTSKWALLILELGDQIINQVHDLFEPEDEPLKFTPIGNFQVLNYVLDHGIYPPQTATPAQIDNFLKVIQTTVASEITARTKLERISTQARAAGWTTP